MNDERQFLELYDLERYLFEVVNRRFHDNGKTSAFDFYCVLIWKANRAKKLNARKVLREGMYKTLDEGVEAITSTIFCADSAKARLDLLLDEWKFRLPTATAILAVFYPQEFTVYDIRVCDELQKFHNLKDQTESERRWKTYLEFCGAMKSSTPAELSLRDKDRWLWGRSFSNQLTGEIDRFGIEQPSHRPKH
jgi:hypothetical protein